MGLEQKLKDAASVEPSQSPEVSYQQMHALQEENEYLTNEVLTLSTKQGETEAVLVEAKL
jgi:hypothetical protein